MVTAAAVSVGGMGSSVLATLGRGPVVTPGAGRLRGGDVEDLLAGVVRPHRLVALDGSRAMVVERGRVGVDDLRGLGGEPMVDHARGASVVGHGGLGGVCPTALGRGSLYTFVVE